ncbi:ABC transporter substrate-binding protein [Rhizomonospora bruguierae]|uniref:ABC transporter substrate-binding protein n=1 Tax=Rhizomonospora bruguierae TaxID=1581705 RepID=UPI001BCC3414|nr:extracellular solute-binding protein [Micromonospora sp. NBRC 107566]
MLLVGAAVLTLVLGACSSGPEQPAQAASGWEAIKAAADKEGKLVISVHAGAGFEEWGRLIQDKFPNWNISVTSIGPSESVPRILSEQQNGRYLWDLIIGPNSAVHNGLAPAGALADARPILADLPDEVRRDEDWHGGFEMFGEPGQGTSFLNQINMTGGVYVNTKLAPEITKADDLLKPEYRGKIVAEDLRQPAGATQIVAALFSAYGQEYVQKLVQQDIKLVANKQVALEWLADGRAVAAIGPTIDIVDDYKKLGLGDGIERRNEIGMFGLAQSVNILKNPPHPNATRVFLAYFLSQEGQDLWAKVSRADASSRRKDVPRHNDYATDYTTITDKTLVQGSDREGDLLDRTLEITSKMR